MEELKRCPFCGGEASCRDGIWEKVYDEGGAIVNMDISNPCVFIVECSCGAQIVSDESEDTVIAAWNRRADGWILAEDYLPDIGDVCLCRIEHNYADDGWSAYRVYEYGGEGYWITMGNLCFVTHWMPLPAPPKGE